MKANPLSQANLEETLAGLPVVELRYYPTISSTNTAALDWIEQGCHDLSLIIADEQTAGRGRLNRQWFTPARAGLAFSLVLLPPAASYPGEPLAIDLDRFIVRYTALGALGVCDALQSLFGLEAEIKWPNDVLLGGKKVCGILAEASWHGGQLKGVVLGIGLNVTASAIPPVGSLRYPATCVENHTGANISRLNTLREVLARIIFWHEHLFLPDFIRAWQARLAFLGQQVDILSDHPAAGQHKLSGEVIGLDPLGSLVIRDKHGELLAIQHGEISLRPAASSEC